MGLRKNECWPQNRSGTFRGCAFYLLFCVCLCLFICILKAVVCILFDWFLRRLYFILKTVVCILKTVVCPCLACGICWRQNRCGIFPGSVFFLPFLSCLSYFLTCVSFCVWSSAIFLLSWTQVEAEKPSPRFDILPSLGCPFVLCKCTVYFIDYR